MHIKRFTNWYFCFVMLLTVLASSCQKDAGYEEIEQKKLSANADSALNSSSPDNYLASSGTLTVKVQDSTYVFDASVDSVAFVNLHVGGDRFFGITAINKAHTVSFGISSPGVAASKLNTPIAGGQLLFKPDAIHTDQFTLTRYAEPGDAGKIKLTAYRQKTVLAKGKFFTFMAKGDSINAPFYRVEGKFDLMVAKPDTTGK
jgi:hypothetical protein